MLIGDLIRVLLRLLKGKDRHAFVQSCKYVRSHGLRVWFPVREGSKEEWCRRGRFLVLQHYDQSFTFSPEFMQDALFYACFHGCEAATRALVTSGAKANRCSIEIANKSRLFGTAGLLLGRLGSAYVKTKTRPHGILLAAVYEGNVGVISCILDALDRKTIEDNTNLVLLAATRKTSDVLQLVWRKTTREQRQSAFCCASDECKEWILKQPNAQVCSKGRSRLSVETFVRVRNLHPCEYFEGKSKKPAGVHDLSCWLHPHNLSFTGECPVKVARCLINHPDVDRKKVAMNLLYWRGNLIPDELFEYLKDFLTLADYEALLSLSSQCERVVEAIMTACGPNLRLAYDICKKHRSHVLDNDPRLAEVRDQVAKEVQIAEQERMMAMQENFLACVPGLENLCEVTSSSTFM